MREVFLGNGKVDFTTETEHNKRFKLLKALRPLDNDRLGFRIVRDGPFEFHESFYPHKGGEVPIGFALHMNGNGYELVKRVQIVTLTPCSK